MRIGIFTDSYLPIRHGVTSSIESFRKTFEKLGHTVIVYAPHNPGYKDKHKVFRFKSLRVIRKPELRFAFPILNEDTVWDMLNTKLDIVHAQTPFSLGILGKIISKSQHIPIVYTHHTDYYEYAKFYLREKVVSPYLAKKITVSFTNAADAVIAPSNKVKAHLEKANTQSPIYVIPNGIDLNEFSKELKAPSDNLRNTLKIRAGDKVVFSLGRLCKEKNLGFLIESFSELCNLRDDVKFIIAGDGPEQKRLKSAAKKLGLEDKIIFPGYVTDEEKAALYKMSDIFWFSSKTDTQGIVILEAMAARLPIVALEDGAFEGMVTNGKNGFIITNSSPGGFALKTAEILGDPSLKDRMGRESLKIAQRFSEIRSAKKILKLYKELIKK